MSQFNCDYKNYKSKINKIIKKKENILLSLYDVEHFLNNFKKTSDILHVYNILKSRK